MQLVSSSKTYLRPLSSAVITSSPAQSQQTTSTSLALVKNYRLFGFLDFNIIVLQLPARSFQTSAVSRDIDSAAKFIGAGAATVGVAGSGKIINQLSICEKILPYDDLP